MDEDYSFLELEPPPSISDPLDEPYTFWQDEALNTLAQYVLAGVEYPEAHTRVCAEFSLNVEQGEELAALYDEEAEYGLTLERQIDC